jgi:hypothetical protein
MELWSPMLFCWFLNQEIKIIPFYLTFMELFEMMLVFKFKCAIYIDMKLIFGFFFSELRLHREPQS